MIRTLLLLVVAVAADMTLRATSIETTETAEGILFTEGGAKVLFYQRAPKSFNGAYTRNNYVHPLWDLNDRVLTEDAPEDHLHQRGIFWAWHQTWVGKIRLGDAWECKDFMWDIVKLRVGEAGDSARRLTATVLWKSSAFLGEEQRPQPVVQETTHLTVYPRRDRRRIIDFDIELLALVEGVAIGGSEDAKGYGGFSLRLRCPGDLRFLSSTGEVEPQTTVVRAGPMMDFVGSFDDKQSSGLAVFCHPGNPDPVTGWILRRSRSMQNPVYPGSQPVPISSREATRLRYRLVLHHGALMRDDLEAMYRDYSAIAP